MNAFAEISSNIAPPPAAVFGHRRTFRVSRFWGGAFRVSTRAFTLIELLTVVFIIALLAAITLPSVRALTQNNSRAQGLNLARTMITEARSIAMAQHRQAGVVFYEESDKFAKPANPHQTAMQIVIEDYDQAQYDHDPENTVFIAYAAQRQYLPAGIKVSAFNDDPAHPVMTGDDDTGSRGITRAILFNADGQMITRHGLARRDLGGGGPGSPARVYGDWNFTTKGGPPHMGISSPGLLLVDMADYRAQNFDPGHGDDLRRAAWIKDHADILMVNTYTGNIIR